VQNTETPGTAFVNLSLITTDGAVAPGRLSPACTAAVAGAPGLPWHEVDDAAHTRCLRITALVDRALNETLRRTLLRYRNSSAGVDRLRNDTTASGHGKRD
jgi:hypothetical protein